MLFDFEPQSIKISTSPTFMYVQSPVYLLPNSKKCTLTSPGSLVRGMADNSSLSLYE